MSRVHDMGGRFGDGAIDPTEPDEVFPQDWHGTRPCPNACRGGDWDNGIWTYPATRGNVCRPTDYARFGYYEKWIAGLTDLLVENGVVTQEELSTLIPAPNSRLQERKMLAEYVAKILASGGPADRPSDIPALFTSRTTG
jgi:nitrile hydratase